MPNCVCGVKEIMIFKPMKADQIEDTSALVFPLLASFKLDGIRASVQGGQLLSSQLKSIPNIQVQKRFAGLPEDLDGELIYGDPTAEDVFSNTTSVVMSDNKPADEIKYHVFDIYGSEGFRARAEKLIGIVYDRNHPLKNVVYVSQKLIENEEQLLEMEKEALEKGYEGLMIRSIDGPYKQGRSTVKQGWLLKLKRFKDAEAKIIGFEEEQKNTNEATTNALGRTERSSAKAGLVGKGTLGKFEVVGVNGQYKGVEFAVGGGLTADQRKQFWQIRKSLIGKIIKYKYFPIGSIDKPRFPGFLGFRDKRDMSL